MPSVEADRRALRKAGQRRDEQPLLAERRPVALGILDQLVGLRDPDGAAAALEPVVEQDAGDLAALAGAGAVAEHPAAPEADGALGAVGRGRDRVEGLVHVPCAREEAGMRLARIDHAFELGVGQKPVGDDGRRQMRPVGRAWAARPTPSRPIARAGSGAASRPECGSTAARSLRRAPR